MKNPLIEKRLGITFSNLMEIFVDLWVLRPKLVDDGQKCSGRALPMSSQFTWDVFRFLDFGILVQPARAVMSPMSK